MSRIIVKGLVSNIDPIYLKNHFSNFGTLTDLKLIRNKYGREKNFAFLGFLEKDAAKKCIMALNKTFLGKERIVIERAFRQLPREKDINQHKTKKSDITNWTKDIVEKTNQTGQLFLRNLPLICTKDDIEYLFKPFGFISYVKILKPKWFSNQSINGTIVFAVPECAIKAASFLDGKIFKGRILHIVPGLGGRKNSLLEIQNSSLTIFKKTREKIEKNNPFHNRSWFWFFVPSEFLIRGLFSKFGLTDKVSVNYQDIKLNLGCLSICESRIQYESALYLEKEGINLNALNPSFFSKKSRKVLLLKNFSFEDKFIKKKIIEHLRSLKKCISLPTIDLVFLEFKNKKKANEAYCKFEKFIKKNNNFLEWAPLNSIQKKTTVPIKTTIHFSVLTNDDTNRKYLFNQEKKKKTNSVRSPEKINWFVSKKSTGKSSSNFDKEIAGKLLVRNIPFQAKLWDLRKIYTNFGKLVSIRMPKKKDGSFRGFAFVIFSSIENAKKALLVSQSVHLFSRRLIPSIIE